MKTIVEIEFFNQRFLQNWFDFDKESFIDYMHLDSLNQWDLNHFPTPWPLS